MAGGGRGRRGADGASAAPAAPPAAGGELPRSLRQRGGAAFAEELVGGHDAIALLGLDAARLPLPGVPAISSEQQQGLSPERLKELLLRDPDLRVSTENRRLVFTCGGLVQYLPNVSRAPSGHRHHHRRLQGAGAPSRGPGRLLQQSNPDDSTPISLTVNEAGLPLLHRCADRWCLGSEVRRSTGSPLWGPRVENCMVPSYRSRPSSTRTILIDFDGYAAAAGHNWLASSACYGYLAAALPPHPRRIHAPRRHTTTDTLWNSKVSRPVITTPPFDLDRSPGTFNDWEQQNIAAIWRAVAEDYAAFDVGVGHLYFIVPFACKGGAAGRAPMTTDTARLQVFKKAIGGGLPAARGPPRLQLGLNPPLAAPPPAGDDRGPGRGAAGECVGSVGGGRKAESALLVNICWYARPSKALH